MPRFKRTQIVQFPSAGKGDEAKVFWSKLTDPVTIQEYGCINSISVCPANSLVAATAYSKVQIYDLETKELHKSFTKFQGAVYGGRFRKDGGLLCAGTGEGQVKVFDVASKTMLRVLKGHAAATKLCDFTLSDNLVVSWSDDKSIKLWDLASESSLSTLTGHTDYVRAGCTIPESPDLLVSGGYDHTLALWDRRLASTDTPSLQMNHGAPVEACLALPGGGLLASAGGNYVKIWDLVGGGKLLANISVHSKTVTSLGVSGSGGWLVSGSLDRQVQWIDLKSFRSVHSLQYPAQIMSLGVTRDDKHLVAGMLDGLVQIHTRKEEEVVDGMRVNTKRYKDKVSHRYLRYTQFTATSGDVVINEHKKDIELKHDALLRKYEFSKALDSVLKPFVARRKPEYGFSLILELSRRGVLKTALAGRDEKGLSSILQFVIRYITDSRFTEALIHVADLLMDLYLPEHGMSSEVDRLFVDLKKRLSRELYYIEELLVLQGATEMVLSAASAGNRIPQDKIEHRLVDLAI